MTELERLLAFLKDFKERGLLTPTLLTRLNFLTQNRLPEVELVPTNEVVRFRDINREITPKSPEQFKRLLDAVRKEGIKEPATLILQRATSNAFLGEGNTRTAIARMLGIQDVPVGVLRFEGGREFSPAGNLPLRSVKVPKPDEFGHIPAFLKPSQLGLETVPRKEIIEGFRTLMKRSGRSIGPILGLLLAAILGGTGAAGLFGTGDTANA